MGLFPKGLSVIAVVEMAFDGLEDGVEVMVVEERGKGALEEGEDFLT